MTSWSWAEPYPDIHKLCVLFNRTELLSPVRWHYTPLQTYLQNGPQCGLVALAILMGKPCDQLVKEIFKYAKCKNFTYNGEIFSTEYMCSLAKEFMMNRNVEVYIGSLESKKIVNILLDGGYLLVPYDTNKDNSPGLHRGHKAHWCVVSGVIETQDEIFVCARHGKARNVAIWRLSELAHSNQQLFEFSPDREFQNIQYKLPDGGIHGPLGLNSQSVLIFKQDVMS